MTDPQSPGSDPTWQEPRPDQPADYWQRQSDEAPQYGQPTSPETPTWQQAAAEPATAQPYEQPYEQPYDSTTYPPPQPYGQTVPYAQQPYAQPMYAQPVYVGQPTNGLAIAALVCALVGLAPVGAILGHIARGQIARSGEQGDGIALAAIIIGWIFTGLFVCGCGLLFGFPLLALLGMSGATGTQ